MEYDKCLVQLDEIFNYIPNYELSKIPKEIRKGIKEQKNKDFIWKFDKTKELKEQNLDRKTIAMLSYLNMEYLLNNEQKELMEKIHKANEQKLEKEKQEKYSSNVLFKNTDNNTIQSQVALIEVKENKWYNKILEFIRNIFKRA